MTRQYLALMIAPVSQSNGHTTAHNIAVAKDWYPFLRELTADMPITITCPWLVGILLGDQDGDPAQRERGLVDSETGAAHCDLTIAVGQTVTLTTGMAREEAACPGPWVDLLDLGMEYETPQRMGRDRREVIRERLREAMRCLRSVESAPDNERREDTLRRTVEAQKVIIANLRKERDELLVELGEEDEEDDEEDDDGTLCLNFKESKP